MNVIIDYGMGNLGSVKNMIKKVGSNAIISSDPRDIMQSQKLILPGVGSFDQGMINLKQRGLLEVLNQRVLIEKVPILGICLGFQLLSKSSEEGQLPGLGWIAADTKKFKFDADLNLKTPHMGWNEVYFKSPSLIFRDWRNEARFYFVHSYHVVCHDLHIISSVSNHGYEFVSSIQNDNIYGVQFHPEKSHKYGMMLLRNFLCV
jgi:imidazole glycerol-phosphate synthase subunit HisH